VTLLHIVSSAFSIVAILLAARLVAALVGLQRAASTSGSKGLDDAGEQQLPGGP
jgi:hypothetical protein